MIPICRVILITIISLPLVVQVSTIVASEPDSDFEGVTATYLDQFPNLWPVRATGEGDHRNDSELDNVDQSASQRQLTWLRGILESLQEIDASKLSRENQVDYALFRHELEAAVWQTTELQEWAWNPLIYTAIAGDAIYDLTARNFAPEAARLVNVRKRLQQLPRFLAQVRESLVPERVPAIHAKTAVSQNRGLLAILKNSVEPRVKQLPEAEQSKLNDAIKSATRAIDEHQAWLETELLPNAKGNFRLGRKLYDRKLAFSLHAPLDRQSIRTLAKRHIEDLHQQMYEIARPLYEKQYPLTQFPNAPSQAFRRAIIRFGLEKANAEIHARDQVVQGATESLRAATDFIRENGIVTIPPDPLDVIIMPEFQRGVTTAYCDSPGPLDVNQKTFYAVSPIPNNWTDEQARSYLREYNTRSLEVLTIHEAMPGHFLQLAHSSRYPGELRRLLGSGVFIEGWAIYTELMMCEEGYLNHDPLMKLVTLKWYLRDVTNALLDQAIHVDGMSREEAMLLMVEDAFQEEREAAGKWVRAQLTSAQLSTYFVGKVQVTNIRREAEKLWGDDFDLKTFHDRLLSFGSPPPQFVRALLFDYPIPLTTGNESK